jgi:hypothetical protein
LWAANAGDAMLTAAITAPSISLEAVAMLFPSVRVDNKTIALLSDAQKTELHPANSITRA